MTKKDQARHISCVDILLDAGYSPVDKQKGAIMFMSPWRNEKAPSLCIYKNNKWVDFGEDVRAKDSIDLYSRLHQTSFTESIDMMLGNDFSSVKSLDFDNTPNVVVVDVRIISSYFLEVYLKSRRISLDLARVYCNEIDIEFTKSPGKIQTVIGFKNNLGGYEYRSKYYKGSVSPKSITIIDGSNESIVFEGFFDFLSYLEWIRSDKSEKSVIVLNSTSMWMMALNYMKGFTRNHLFLNNDKSGMDKTIEMSSLSTCEDHSSRYSGYNDLNDFIRGIKNTI